MTRVTNHWRTRLFREVDPRYVSDTFVKALAIKRYLEEKGFYTRKERHDRAEDPAASFLFGNLKGYCVHFAHAAALALSQRRYRLAGRRWLCGRQPDERQWLGHLNHG